MSALADVAALTAALVRHRTEDPPGREIELARFVCDALRASGIEASVDEFAPGRANVLGRIAGGHAPALVFSAHLDTMPAGNEDAWSRPPFEGRIESGLLYGRGAADMKGGLAAMLSAAGALAEAQLAGDLLLALSAGESSSCLGARRFVDTGALAGAGAILVSEPSSMRALTAEAGALWLRLVASGAPGHASGGGGDSAVERLVDAVISLRAAELPGGEHPLLGRASVSVGTFHGGTAVNLTPDRAAAENDVRYLPGTRQGELLDAVGGAVGEGVAVEVIDDKPPVETSADHPFVAACLAALESWSGRSHTPGGARYFSDSNVLCPALGVPRVIIGPGGLGMSGQRDEHVALDDLRAAAKLYEAIARGWLAPR